MSSADIEAWLKPTLRKQGLRDYSIQKSGNSEKGDGYLGDITFVEVTGKTASNESKTLNFVIKCAKRSKDLREAMPIRKAFENEMYVYNEILPTFLEFQNEKGVGNPFNNAARCYDTLILEEMEILILENLKEKGYSLHGRFNAMDGDHVRKVVETYGKLHAMSFALRDQKPELFKKLSGNLSDILKLMSEKVVPNDVNVYRTIAELAKEENDDDIVEKTNILNKISRHYNDITDPTDPYAVILHGDCWNNNFMFKYTDKEKTKLSDVCLLDFQLSRLASPAYDLAYFLFTCLSEEDIGNFDEINNIYYESFSSFLRKLGSDPDRMFPYEELWSQWKRFSLFGLVLLPSIIQICISDKDDAPDLEKIAEAGSDFASAFSGGVKNVEQYRKRTLPIMRLASSRGFI